MSEQPTLYDVIIVGAGPVGLAAALFLGQQNARVLLLERERAAYPFPRAVHLDDESLRILEQIGLFPELSEALAPFQTALFLDRHRRPFWREDFGHLSQPNGFAPRNWFHQPALEQLMQERLRQLPTVHFYEKTSVTSLRIRDKYTEVQSSEAKTFWGRFVLGADGGRSTVRQVLGIELKDEDFHQQWVVVDAEVLDKKLRGQLPEAHIQYAIPERPVTYLRGAKGHFRWEFMVLPEESAEELCQRVRDLLHPFADPEKLSLLRVAPYTFHALMARQWRKENVFLLGDAAHLMPPFAGQGLCAGLRDAQNLSWKLLRVLRGQADGSLLDTYEAERRPHVRQITRGAVFMGRVIQTRNPLLASLRNRAFRLLARFPVLRKRIVRKAAGQPALQVAGAKKTPKVGRLFPRIQYFGHQFYCLCRDLPEAAPAELSAKYEVVVFQTGAFPALEQDGWEDLSWALVRPDGYVGASG